MENMDSLIGGFGSWIYEILPLSPFQPYIEQFAALPFLGYLNWFFPIGPALTVMGVWLTVITTYYLYSVILRWLKVIGD